MLFDTHAHVNFNAYKDDNQEVIGRSLSNGVWMINVGSQYETSKRAIEIAEKYPNGVFAAIGLHPIHLVSGIFKVKMDEEETAFNTKEEEFNIEKYKKLAESKKVVAIGEIGLDYYYKPKTKIKTEEFKNLQKDILLKEIGLAKELDLPVIFHCRLAHEDLMEILKEKREIRGVIHCFTGNWEQAKKYLDMGFYLGFNGIMFKFDLKEVIEKTPFDKILVETDCPYLTPPQKSGRNEPLYVKYVVEEISKIKKIDCQKISEITVENAKKLFKI